MQRWFLLGVLVVCGGIVACSGKTGITGPSGADGAPGVGYKSLSVKPTKNNYIGTKYSNNGFSTALQVGMDRYINCPDRILLDFDFTQIASSLPSDAVIVDAVLDLTPSDSLGTTLTCHVYPITTAWAEMTSTWTTPWATPGGDYNSDVVLGSFALTSSSKVSISLDAGWIQSVINGQTENGLLIKATAEDNSEIGMEFYSRNYGNDATKQPTLRLVYGQQSQMSQSAAAARAHYQWLKKQQGEK